MNNEEKKKRFCESSQDWDTTEACTLCPKQIKKRCHKGHNGFLDWLESSHAAIDDDLYETLENAGLLEVVE